MKKKKKTLLALIVVLALFLAACDGQPTTTATVPAPTTAAPPAVSTPTTAPAPTTAPTAPPPSEEQFVWPATVEYELARGKLILQENLPKPDIAGWNALLDLAPEIIEPTGEIRIGVAEIDPFDFVACDSPPPGLSKEVLQVLGDCSEYRGIVVHTYLSGLHRNPWYSGLSYLTMAHLVRFSKDKTVEVEHAINPGAVAARLLLQFRLFEVPTYAPEDWWEWGVQYTYTIPAGTSVNIYRWALCSAKEEFDKSLRWRVWEVAETTTISCVVIPGIFMWSEAKTADLFCFGPYNEGQPGAMGDFPMAFISIEQIEKAGARRKN